jgi:membrane protease YdiL (CAAX protease family)
VLGRFWEQFIKEPLHRVEADTQRYLASPAGRGVDRKVLLVLVTTAVALTVQNYFVTAGVERLVALLAGLGLEGPASRLLAAVEDPVEGEIHRLTYWVAGNAVVYVLIPVTVLRVCFRERIRDYGVKLSGAFTDWWVYLFMLVVMVPLVLLASRGAHFQSTYPFYRLRPDEPLWPNFWRWELEYALQFFCLEFFFRGFLVHGTKHRFGSYAILVMTVPYCMIHYTKPMPEAFASIVAGIVLGFMSLKTRSIWLGTTIHVTVALSMDFTSLWRQGYFG